MEFSVLCDCLNKNGFNVKPLTSAKRMGCIGDYVDTFTSLFNTLEEALVHGVNTHFAKGMKGNIEDIIDLISDISEEKNGLKLKKYSAKVEKVVEKTEKVMRKGDILIMKSELLERIDTYIEGTQAYLDDETRPERREVLSAGLEKLKEIKAAVENVSVFTGKEAQEHATEIVSSLKVWSNDVADSMQDEQSLKSLDAALDKTKGWAGIRSTRKGEVDMTKITFDENDMEDGLTAAVKVRRFDVKANHFRENLATYTETVERRYSTEKDEARLAKEEETRDSLKARIKEVRTAYQNGEMSEDDALDELEDITADLDDAEGEIADLKDYIRETKTAGSAFRRHLRMLERLMEVIDKYAGDYVKLGYIYGEIDFDALNNVMRGNADQEDIDSVRIFGMVEKILQQEELGTIGAAAVQIRGDREGYRVERQTARREKRERKRDAETTSRLKGLLGEEPEDENEENTERQNRRNSLRSTLLDEN